MSGDLVRLANDQLDAPAFEAAALAHLQREVGFDVAFLSVKGAEEAPTTVALGPDIVQRAVQHAPRYIPELLPTKRAALAARGVAVDTSVLGERRVHESAYYRELARPVGGRHSLLAYVPLRGRTIALVMLGRTGTTFSHRAIAKLESLLPELGVALGSYGLPVSFSPLSPPSQPGLIERLGLGKLTHVRASRVIGDATIEVRDRGGFREMVASSGGEELVWTRAGLQDPSVSGWPYIELLHQAAVQARSRRRALFVGCGGAVAVRQFTRVYPGLAIDLVEREPAVIELARTWYDLDAIPGVTVHVEDGQSYVQRAPSSCWDIAVVDTFDHSDSPQALTERPFFSALRRTLRPGGAMAINVIGTLDGEGAVRRVVDNLSSVFATVLLLPVMEVSERYSPSALRNVVVVASGKR